MGGKHERARVATLPHVRTHAPNERLGQQRSTRASRDAVQRQRQGVQRLAHGPYARGAKVPQALTVQSVARHRMEMQYLRAHVVEHAQMNLTEHLLTIAGEECAEIAQRTAKALRFGLNQTQMDADDRPEENPERLDNRERIRREYLHLIAVMDMLGIYVNGDDVHAHIVAKKERVRKYLERSRRDGTLTE